MPRFLRYEDAVFLAQRSTRLTVETLVRSLDAAPVAAASVLRRLEAEGIVGPAEADGAHPVLGQTRRRRWAAPAEPPAPPRGPEADVARLRAELAHWVARASAAEAALAERGSRRDTVQERLRRMLAKELHPDSVPAGTSEDERMRYAELFKRLWPRIEVVLLDRTPPEDGVHGHAEP